MLIRADARFIPLADQSAHCAVTSPPYRALRDYGLEPSIWGGQADCKHRWNGPKQKYQRGKVGSHSTLQGGSQPSECKNGSQKIPQGQWCLSCSAWRGNLGLEPTAERYVQNLVEIFREVRRVLRDDGVLFLNLGDSFASEGGFRDYGSHDGGTGRAFNSGMRASDPGLKPLDRCDVPGDVARALRADGWYWRQTIIWAKENPMPESVNGWRWERHRVKTGYQDATRRKPAGWDTRHQSPTELQGNYQNNQIEPSWADCPGCVKCAANEGLVLRRGAWRPTTSHEYIFLFAKTPHYFCDAAAVREPHGMNRWGGSRYSGTTHIPEGRILGSTSVLRKGGNHFPGSGRNLRSVWRFSTQPLSAWTCLSCGKVSDPRPQDKKCPGCGAGERFDEAGELEWTPWESHFATFPERLPEICIRAGTSERGCCRKCGAPWARVVDHQNMVIARTDRSLLGKYGNAQLSGIVLEPPHTTTLGWRPTCQCVAGEPVPCLVLDPFAGSGTVGRVAERLGRRWVCADLKYQELVKERTNRVQKELTAWELECGT